MPTEHKDGQVAWPLSHQIREVTVLLGRSSLGWDRPMSPKAPTAPEQFERV